MGLEGGRDLPDTRIRGIPSLRRQDNQRTYAPTEDLVRTEEVDSPALCNECLFVSAYHSGIILDTGIAESSDLSNIELGSRNLLQQPF